MSSELFENDAHIGCGLPLARATTAIEARLVEVPSPSPYGPPDGVGKGSGSCTQKAGREMKMEKEMAMRRGTKAEIRKKARTKRSKDIPMQLKQQNEDHHRSQASSTKDRSEQKSVSVRSKKSTFDWIRSMNKPKQHKSIGYGTQRKEPTSAINSFLVIADWDYEPQNTDELGLHQGDVVQVLTKHESGWWDGLSQHERGWFPSNYCSKVDVNLTLVEAADDHSESTNTKHNAFGGDHNIQRDVGKLHVNKSHEPKIQQPAAEQEEPSVRRTLDNLKALQKMSVRRGSEVVSPAELRSDLEFYSEGELSFVERHSNSGTTTPTSNLSSSSKDVALDLASRILADFIKRRRQRSTTDFSSRETNDTSERGSQTSSSVSSPSRTSAWSKDTTVMSLSSQKRRLGPSREASDEDDDEGLAGQPSNKRARPDTEEAIKLFACPFAKYDSERYSERNVMEREYRSCSSCLLRDIPRLKQHLYRVHKRPEHYCPSCFEAFKSRTLLDRHVRDRSCGLREPLYEEKMTIDQMKDIKRRSRGGSSIENWFSIFKILFPGEPLPSSPYAGEGDATQTAIQHFVSFFRTYGPENFFDLIRDRQGTFPRLDASTQEIVDEAFEITAPELLRQLQIGRTVDTSSNISSLRQQEPVIAAAISVAASLSERLHNGEVIDRQQALSEVSGALEDNNNIWSAMPASPQIMPPNSFNYLDFDGPFDPLTIDDAFDSYGPWIN